MSPMRYIKVRRLNAVRQHLKVRDRKRITIARVANQCGFWSLGHFIRDYQAMFGELLSQTEQN